MCDSDERAFEVKIAFVTCQRSSPPRLRNERRTGISRALVRFGPHGFDSFGRRLSPVTKYTKCLGQHHVVEVECIDDERMNSM